MDENVLARYNSAEGADDYLHKFERHWTERVNDWHEQRLIRRFLRSVASVDPAGFALDLPCGYGRLYPIVRELGIPVVEGDWSFPLLAAARKIHARRYQLERVAKLRARHSARSAVWRRRLRVRAFRQTLASYQGARTTLAIFTGGPARQPKMGNVYLFRCRLHQESDARIWQAI